MVVTFIRCHKEVTVSIATHQDALQIKQHCPSVLMNKIIMQTCISVF